MYVFVSESSKHACNVIIIAHTRRHRHKVIHIWCETLKKKIPCEGGNCRKMGQCNVRLSFGAVANCGGLSRATDGHHKQVVEGGR